MSKIYKRIPKTHQMYDVARSLNQAIEIQKSYEKSAGAIIVRTKDNKIFPYHIAVKRSY